VTQYQPPVYPGAHREHPQATTILVLGILSLAVCGLVGPFAWSMGNRALREIDASYGQLTGRDMVNIGRILGMVGTILLGVGIAIFLVAFLVPLLIAIGSSTS
jgi:uncharacterized membrane protein YjgN (DUF898 family)